MARRFFFLFLPWLRKVASRLMGSLLLAEGLENYGTSLSQIPTYVTAVPNGTEKVSPGPLEAGPPVQFSSVHAD